MRPERVAVVGATGLVGEMLLEVLEERKFPVGKLTLFTSGGSAGTTLRQGGRDHPLVPLEEGAFRGVDLAFFMASGEIAWEWVPRAREEGAIVIDNSATFRMRPDIPLVVPEVNASALLGHRGLIANPNCTTVQVAVAVNPLHRLAPLRRVLVATYQAISGAGRGPREQFWREVGEALGEEAGPAALPPESLAFNLMPAIDRLLPDAFSREEEKVMEELPKILGAPGLAVAATAVRVPVDTVHCAAVYVETERPLSPEEVRAALRKAPGVDFREEGEDRGLLSPRAVAGRDIVVVGRLRRDRAVAHGIHLWVVGDNLRKGAATNAVQIAELLL